MLIQGLGDIWVLVRGATLMVRTLHTAVTKAPKQVQELHGDAARLKSLLLRIESMVNEQGAVLKPHDEIKRDMVQVLRRCGEMVEALEHIATSHQSIVEKEGEASGAESKAKQWLRAMNSPQGLYRRIRWTTMESAVCELRELLAQHMQALQVIMQFLATQQIAQLQVGVSQILHLMEQQPGRVGQNLGWVSNISPSTSPRSPPIDSGSQTSTTGTPFTSPLIAAQSTTYPRWFPDSDHRPNESSSPVRFEGNRTPPLERLELPEAAIDPFNCDFPPKIPDLVLNFPAASADDFDYAGPASDAEHKNLVTDITRGRGIVAIPVQSVSFVFRKSPVSPRVVIDASDAGQILLLKTLSRGATAVAEIWTLNTAHTVRMRQKLPVWDDVVPYSAHGDKKSAVVEQGSGLSFVVFEKGHRETHSIPTTWVTYKFWCIEDCQSFQEHLFGWKLLLTVLIRQIYRSHTIKSDELVAGRENIRIWKDPSGSEIQFMVHLQMREGRKKYLQFDLRQESIKHTGEGDYKLHLEGINAIVDGVLHTNERKHSISSVSSNGSVTSRRSSMLRRFSQDRSSILDKITIECSSTDDRNDLLQLVLSSRTKSGNDNPTPSRASTFASPQMKPDDESCAKSKETG